MNKHTPGPWRVAEPAHRPREETRIVEAETEDAYVWICEVYSDGTPAGDERDMQADAALIAAAPEMLEALRSVIEIADGGDFGHVLTFESARALIARIEND